MKLELLDSSIWRNLHSKSANSEGFVVYEELSVRKRNPGVFLYVSKDNSLHCAILLAKQDVIQKTSTRPLVGLSICEKKVVIKKLGRVPVIDISYNEKYTDLFTWFIKDIASRYLERNVKPREAVLGALTSGQRFWHNPNVSVMDLKKQLGLWGEIHCLRVLLSAKGPSVISAWTGPLGEDYDFCFYRTHIETKTTLRPRHEHEISNLEQLDPPKGSTLFVWSSTCVADELGTSVLEEALKAISDVKNNPQTQELLEEKLAKAGLRPDHEKSYTQNRFRESNRQMYEVKNGFPRITANSFKLPLSRAILKVSYTISLEEVKKCAEAILFNKISTK